MYVPSLEMAEMVAMTAVSAMGALTTIVRHCQAEVLCKFEGHRRKFFPMPSLEMYVPVPGNVHAAPEMYVPEFFPEFFNEIANIASSWAEKQ